MIEIGPVIAEPEVVTEQLVAVMMPEGIGTQQRHKQITETEIDHIKEVNTQKIQEEREFLLIRRMIEEEMRVRVPVSMMMKATKEGGTMMTEKETTQSWIVNKETESTCIQDLLDLIDLVLEKGDPIVIREVAIQWQDRNSKLKSIKSKIKMTTKRTATDIIKPNRMTQVKQELVSLVAMLQGIKKILMSSKDHPINKIL